MPNSWRNRQRRDPNQPLIPNSDADYIDALEVALLYEKSNGRVILGDVNRWKDHFKARYPAPERR